MKNNPTRINFINANIYEITFRVVVAVGKYIDIKYCTPARSISIIQIVIVLDPISLIV